MTTAPPETLGSRVSKGAVFMIGQAMLSRGATFIGQLVVAWLINPELMGVFAKAMGVTAVFTFVQNLGIRQVLIKRFRRFDRWSGPAFWISLAGGCFACLALYVLAVPLSRLMGEPRSAILIAIMATAMPFNAIANVPRARLGGELRFRESAMIDLVVGTGTQILTMLMAIGGAGTLALAVPRPVIAIATCGWLFRIAPIQIRSRYLWRRAKLLLFDSGVITLTLICSLLISNGDYLILGLLRGPEENGLYYFAYGLSVQAVTVVGFQLSNLLFPAFSSVKDPQQQVDLFSRSIPLLTYCVAFTAFLQAALASPFFRTFIAPEYAAAAVLMQLLCLGMALRPIGWVSGSLMQAQGRFVGRLSLVAVDGLIFLGLAAVGVAMAGNFGLAVAVALFSVFEIVLLISGACWRVKGAAVHCLTQILRPLLIASASTFPVAMICDRLTSGSRWANLLLLAVAPVVAAALLVSLVRLLDYSTYLEVGDRVRKLRRRADPQDTSGPAQ